MLNLIFACVPKLEFFVFFVTCLLMAQVFSCQPIVFNKLLLLLLLLYLGGVDDSDEE